MKSVCGIDEVGRGALAGPLVACGVVLEMDAQDLINKAPVEIRDSKKMTKLQRERLMEWLGIGVGTGLVPAQDTGSTEVCGNISGVRSPISGSPTVVAYQLAKISVIDINHYGIGWANRRVFELIVEQLKADEYILDGRIKVEIPHQVETSQSFKSVRDDKAGLKSLPALSNSANKPLVVYQPKADAEILEVMLAANIAKVYRDRLMADLHTQFPHYDWHKNVGYGTMAHLEALDVHGACEYHRMKFVETALIKKRSEQKVLL